MSTTINAAEFLETHRPFGDMQGLVNSLRRLQTVWSWGAQGWTRMNANCLRFAVKGHHHRGHVYLAVNGGDLFDVYLTTSRGTIKHTVIDLFLEDLVDAIDVLVERIPEYKT